MRRKKTNSPSQWQAAPPAVSRRQFVLEGAVWLGGLSLFGGAALGIPLERTPSAADAAQAKIEGGRILLGNSVLSAEWQISTAGFQLLRIADRRSAEAIAGPAPVFALTLADGSQVVGSGMRLLKPPETEWLPAEPGASRLSERVAGRAASATFEDAGLGLRAEWRAILRDGSHYIRQEIAFSALKDRLPVSKVTLLDLPLSGGEVAGTVQGSPVTQGTWFLGFEHPLSQSRVAGGRALCSLERQLPLEHGRSASYSSLIGVSAPGQLRRDFLAYLERERAHPYRTFLHYNSWYDLGYFTPYDQAGALDVIRAFCQELHAQRGVVLDSFLFDDGWDNHNSLWDFNSGFPRGFTPLKAAAAECQAAPGIWLSPWGGYDGPRKQRLAYGKAQGYEENQGGFVLSGPRYFHRFREVCLEMIRDYGINQFKFDGTGNASTVFPGSAFDSDFAAMISLIGDLRAARPDLYVNLTTGTYPSPFWLRYADSIWRDGDDHSFAGVGSNRQQWITYRDSATYRYVVGRGPLYPLNSLMLHGLIYARYAEKLSDDPHQDFADEIHSYFGSGTQLQEMYVTHSLLSQSDWDRLAEAARWSRRNADTLVDTHWLGGDPGRLEVYGWACWSPRRGIITLRNPAGAPQKFELDAYSAFELPPHAAENYLARTPWKNASLAPVPLRAGEPHTFTLEPFEVLTLEAVPQ